jgi:hypothetical protein
LPILDLTERETPEPPPAGKYRCTIADAEERETSGQGKLPEGTPMIALDWQIEEALFDLPEDANDPVGRHVFNQVTIPPKEIDGAPYKNYKMMNGILFRFLDAIGYTEEELSSGDFELDYDDLKGREAILTVARREWTDPDTDEKRIFADVKGIKPVTNSEGII